MTKAAQHPTLAAGLTRYPHWKQAEAYLKKFLGRWQEWYSKSHLCAKCRYSASLDIIVIRLAPNIYEVRAYPPGALMVASLEEGLAIEEFRGWIFVNGPRSRKSVLIASTQRIGVEPYKLARLAIRHKGTLNQASQLYRTLV